MTLKVGDKVTRNMGGVLMPLVVTAVTDELISCGDYDFDADCGIEVDDYLMWGPRWGQSGSYLEELM